ncbi:MAG TPA: cyclodeaminase/cyclohydrolase family protein [Alphaproteobacteria bacterium]|nr:cyclodeaminase/cyclohydrolase family protein [Alphaproteobacteria bacterium]
MSDAESVWTWGLAEFRDNVAADNPTPGGGSAAMVSASIGMGLVLMALKISARKEGGDRHLPLVETGERLLVALGAQADDDIAAFQGYMKALQLPKGTDEEKEARRRALENAARTATEVPLAAARLCLEGLDLAQQAVPLAGSHIVSDVAAGAILMHGALSAVLLNVDINLKSIKDEAARADYAALRADLQTQGDARRARIDRDCAERLA